EVGGGDAWSRRTAAADQEGESPCPPSVVGLRYPFDPPLGRAVLPHAHVMLVLDVWEPAEVSRRANPARAAGRPPRRIGLNLPLPGTDFPKGYLWRTLN